MSEGLRDIPEGQMLIEESPIVLTATEYGFMDATFDSVVSNMGDGESFSWAGWADENRSYAIRRTGRGIVEAEQHPVSIWEMDILAQGGEPIAFLLADFPNLKLIDRMTGEEAGFRGVYEAARLMFDLNDLDLRRLTETPYSFRGDGRIEPNLRYFAAKKDGADGKA